ncbi:hypothetical protein [Natronomonas sp.]|uniref:hypothetical protein n=1 Tax=Natronomonas sp. TaxID=2184060 RepID=UPI003988D4F4
MDYKEHRRELIDWLLVFGKKPEKAEGYAQRTVLNTAQRLDLFYRWVWQERGTYTNVIDHEDAEERSDTPFVRWVQGPALATQS